ncbi:MAG: hypothetical protein JWO80_329 [Bryobacterales bacterium]|nr:hypothetical protein [Bryobacterales bacterium]
MPQPPCILIVDDEPAVRRVIRAMLERNQYHVLEAASGEEALAIYLQGQPRVDLVVSDVRMPGMDGNEFVRRLHELQPLQRVIFVTAYPGDLHDSAHRLAALPKPFSSAQLISKVSAQLVLAATA